MSTALSPDALALEGGDEKVSHDLRVVTDMPDDARLVVPTAKGYGLARHALKWQRQWSDDEHRSFWMEHLTLAWPTKSAQHASGRHAGCIWPIGHRGGHRESLAFAVATALDDARQRRELRCAYDAFIGAAAGDGRSRELTVDDALLIAGVTPGAGNRDAIKATAVEYARVLAAIAGDGDMPATFGDRLPRVVAGDEYSGREWLTGRSTLPVDGAAAAHRTEDGAVDAYLRGLGRVMAVLGRTT